jgi:hypothetical protein
MMFSLIVRNFILYLIVIAYIIVMVIADGTLYVELLMVRAKQLELHGIQVCIQLAKRQDLLS